MSKYKDGNYFQLSRLPFKDTDGPAAVNDLSLPAFKLYVWLHELEHRFTAPRPTKKKVKLQTDWFFRSDADLVSDTGLSSGSVIKAKKELKENKFILTWQMHWIVDEKTQKKSYKHVTAFRILK